MCVCVCVCVYVGIGFQYSTLCIIMDGLLSFVSNSFHQNKLSYKIKEERYFIIRYIFGFTCMHTYILVHNTFWLHLVFIQGYFNIPYQNTVPLFCLMVRGVKHYPLLVVRPLKKKPFLCVFSHNWPFKSYSIFIFVNPLVYGTEK